MILVIILFVMPVAAVNISQEPALIPNGGRVNISISELPDGVNFSVDIGARFRVSPDKPFSFEVRNFSMPFTLNSGKVSSWTQGTKTTSFALKKEDALMQVGGAADKSGYYTITREYTIANGTYDYLILSGLSREDTSVINASMKILGEKDGLETSEISFIIAGIDNGELSLSASVDDKQVLSEHVVVGDGIVVPTPDPTAAPTTEPVPEPTSSPTPIITQTTPAQPAPPTFPVDDRFSDGSTGQTSGASAAGIQEVASTSSFNVGGRSAVNSVEATGTGITGLVVTGTVLDTAGSGNPSAPGTVYQYVDIKPVRYTRIDRVIILFSVQRPWLDEQHLSPQDIALYHFGGLTWEKLPTEVIREANGQVYYRASTTGFSRFAIAGERQTIANTSSADETRDSVSSGITAAGTPSPAIIAVTVSQPRVQATPVPRVETPATPQIPENAVLYGIGAGLIVACLIIVYRRTR